MPALSRVTYWLGWVSLVVAFIVRATLNGASSRLVDKGVLPRNFFELSLLLFVISIASLLYARESR
jgi:hypothetical protein